MSNNGNINYWQDKSAGREHTEEEVEWFRLWFEFLKLSDRNKWTKEVKDCFGNLSCGFENWWEEHRQDFVFESDLPQGVTEITSDEEYREWESVYLDKDCVNDNGALIVAVPLWASKESLRSSFEALLKKYHLASAGRPDDFVANQGYIFNLYDKPDTSVLKKILAVYKVYQAEQKKSDKNRMALWEIEEESSKTVELIVKTGPKAEYIWQIKDSGKPDDDKMADEQRKKSQSSTVSKYIKQAEEILENIVLGCFPVYDGSTPSAQYQTKLDRRLAGLLKKKS